MAWTHPPSHAQYGGGGQRAGLLPDLVRQVEPLGQESQRARLPERKGSAREEIPASLRGEGRRKEAGGESPGRQRGDLGRGGTIDRYGSGRDWGSENPGAGEEGPWGDERSRKGLDRGEEGQGRID